MNTNASPEADDIPSTCIDDADYARPKITRSRKTAGMTSMVRAVATLAHCILISVAVCGRAEAAVGLCGDVIVGPMMQAATEMEARKSALEQWQGLAAAVGPEYTRWGIAWNRRIRCEAIAGGMFRCQASGAPCTIKQVPPSPREFQPLHRGPKDSI